MTRTLITGAAGFTGRYVTELLASRHHEVHGIVHEPPDRPIKDIHAVHFGDLADRAKMAAIVDRVRPDHVVHLAAIAFVAHGDVAEMYRTNIVGTRQLLDALADLPTAPSSIVLASSANVYGNGNGQGGVLDEDRPLAPANDYGVTKLAMEYVARLYRDRLPLIVVRPFNYSGRDQSSDFLIAKIVDHARRRAPLIELGNLDVARDFSDVRTVAEVYARLLDCPAAIGNTYNVSSGRSVSLREVIDRVQKISGHVMEVRINPAFVRDSEVRSLAGSSARLDAVVGPLDRIPLDQTLRWMLDA